MRDSIASLVAALLPRRVIVHAYARVIEECMSKGRFDSPDLIITFGSTPTGGPQDAK